MWFAFDIALDKAMFINLAVIPHIAFRDGVAVIYEMGPDEQANTYTVTKKTDVARLMAYLQKNEAKR